MKKNILIMLLFISLVSCEKEVFTGLVENNITEFDKVFVTSNPQGYKLFIDNKYMSITTPDSIPFVSEGIHRLTLKHELYSDSSLNIEVNKNALRSFDIDMMKNPRFYAKVRCYTSPPGAKIFVNDLPTNLVTPAFLTNIYPGEIEIKFTKSLCRTDSVVMKVKGDEYNEMIRSLEDTSKTVNYRMSNSKVFSNVLTKVVVDKYNNKWIGSSDHGLMKFDGHEWISYENSGVLGSESINDLLVDKKGRLWVGSVKGLSLYDGVSWRSFLSELPYPTVTALEEDATGNIWIATLDGLVKYDNISFQVFTSGNTGVPLTNLSCLASSKDGNIWIGSFTLGIINFNGRKWTRFTNSTMEFSPSTSNEIKDIIVDKNGILYAFSTEDTPQGLRSAFFKYDGDTWKILSLPILFKPNIYSFYNDNENNLWLSITGGLVKYNETGTALLYNSDMNGFFSSLSSSFFIDHNGDGWLTTLGGGITRLKRGIF